MKRITSAILALTAATTFAEMESTPRYTVDIEPSEFGSLSDALNIVSMAGRVNLPSATNHIQIVLAFFKDGKLSETPEYGLVSNHIGGSDCSVHLQPFTNTTFRLHFIDTDYLAIKDAPSAHYRLFYSFMAKSGGFSNQVDIPKDVLNLSGTDMGVFSPDLDCPAFLVPLFYVRDHNYWHSHEFEDNPLPEPKEDLMAFLEAAHPNGLLLVFLTTDFKACVKYLRRKGIQEQDSANKIRISPDS